MGRNRSALEIGGVAEWFKAPVLKTGVLERVPWVRIPPPPLRSLRNWTYLPVHGGPEAGPKLGVSRGMQRPRNSTGDVTALGACCTRRAIARAVSSSGHPFRLYPVAGGGLPTARWAHPSGTAPGRALGAVDTAHGAPFDTRGARAAIHRPVFQGRRDEQEAIAPARPGGAEGRGRTNRSHVDAGARNGCDEASVVAFSHWAGVSSAGADRSRGEGARTRAGATVRAARARGRATLSRKATRAAATLSRKATRAAATRARSAEGRRATVHRRTAAKSRDAAARLKKAPGSHAARAVRSAGVAARGEEHAYDDEKRDSPDHVSRL